jgi:hypothetical protein
VKSNTIRCGCTCVTDDEGKMMNVIPCEKHYTTVQMELQDLWISLRWEFKTDEEERLNAGKII